MPGVTRGIPAAQSGIVSKIPPSYSACRHPYMGSYIAFATGDVKMSPYGAERSQLAAGVFNVEGHPGRNPGGGAGAARTSFAGVHGQHASGRDRTAGDPAV